MSETRTIKVNYETDIRRLSVPAKIQYAELYDTVKKLFGFEGFNLKYVDDEGDTISISSDQELVEAFRLHTNSILRLHIFVPDNAAPVDVYSAPPAIVPITIELPVKIQTVTPTPIPTIAATPLPVRPKFDPQIQHAAHSIIAASNIAVEELSKLSEEVTQICNQFSNDAALKANEISQKIATSTIQLSNAISVVSEIASNATKQSLQDIPDQIRQQTNNAAATINGLVNQSSNQILSSTMSLSDSTLRQVDLDLHRFRWRGRRHVEGRSKQRGQSLEIFAQQ